MSIHDVCELNGLLENDDEIKRELENKLNQLNASISFQESRLNDEEDKKQMYINKEKLLICKTENISNDLDVVCLTFDHMIQCQDTLNEEYEQSINNIIKYESDRDYLLNSLDEVLQNIDIITDSISKTELIFESFDPSETSTLELSKVEKEQYVQNLRDNILVTLASQVTDLEKQRDEVSENIANIEIEIKTANDMISQLKYDQHSLIEMSENEVSDTRNVTNELELSYNQANMKNEDLSYQISNMKSYQTSLSNSKSELETQSNQQRLELNRIESEVNSLVELLIGIKSDVTNKTQDIQNMNRSLAEETIQQENFAKNIDKALYKQNVMKENVSRSSRYKEEQLVEYETLQRQLDEIQTNIEIIRLQLNGNSGELKELLDEISQHATIRQKLIGQIQINKEHEATLMNEIQLKQQQRSDYRKDIEVMQNELSSISMVQKELNNSNMKLEAEVKSLNEKDMASHLASLKIELKSQVQKEEHLRISVAQAILVKEDMENTLSIESLKLADERQCQYTAMLNELKLARIKEIKDELAAKREEIFQFPNELKATDEAFKSSFQEAMSELQKKDLQLENEIRNIKRLTKEAMHEQEKLLQPSSIPSIPQSKVIAIDRMTNPSSINETKRKMSIVDTISDTPNLKTYHLQSQVKKAKYSGSVSLGNIILQNNPEYVNRNENLLNEAYGTTTTKPKNSLNLNTSSPFALSDNKSSTNKSRMRVQSIMR